MDWARQNGEYMGAVYDLPGWPGEGGPDGYLRVVQGSGFAFLFNSTSFQQMIRIPLNENVGLHSGAEYTLKQLYPETEDAPKRCKKETRIVLQPRSAYLLQILATEIR
jgi:hypothetical protein